MPGSLSAMVSLIICQEINQMTVISGLCFTGHGPFLHYLLRSDDDEDREDITGNRQLPKFEAGKPEKRIPHSRSRLIDTLCTRLA
jgi:hypothetical protein